MKNLFCIAKKRIFLYFFSAVITATLIAGCYGCSLSEEKGAVYLGSFLSSDVYLYLEEGVSEETHANLLNKCSALIEELEYDCSVSSSGCVALFNALKGGEKTEISYPVYEIILKSKNIYSKTGGAFDPTVYPLVDLWGFSYRFDNDYLPQKPYDRQREQDGSLALPSDSYITAFSSLVGFDLVSVCEEDGKYYLKKDGAGVTVDGTTYERAVDLSSVAKGYLTDGLKKIVEDFSVKRYYISIGTSSLYLGERSGGAWATQFVDPKSPSREPLCEAEISLKSVSTSGTYEKSYVYEGVLCHHVIDGATGRSADSDIVSAVVVGDDGAECDALSTALVVMGLDRALSFAEKESDKDYIFITDTEIYSTLALKNVAKSYVYRRI